MNQYRCLSDIRLCDYITRILAAMSEYWDVAVVDAYNRLDNSGVLHDVLIPAAPGLNCRTDGYIAQSVDEYIARRESGTPLNSHGSTCIVEPSVERTAQIEHVMRSSLFVASTLDCPIEDAISIVWHSSLIKGNTNLGEFSNWSSEEIAQEIIS